MGTHHYLGAAPKVGETLWYGAAWRGEWVALASFSAAALKCQARDAWIGWTLRHKYDRLHLVANNTRFLILRPVPNLGSRVLGLCARHLVRDWPARFHHPLVLLETFVDPSRFVGTVYRAAGWTEVGMTRGFRRVRGGYRAGSTPKKVLVRPLKVAPDELDTALRAWFSAHGHDDASLAIDGKTMKGAVDEAGRQVHILGACGHETAIPWGQKKPC